MKINRAYCFCVGVTVGYVICQIVNSYRQKALVRLEALNSVGNLAYVYYEKPDWFLRVTDSMLDGLIIGAEKYSRYMTPNEKIRKEKLFMSIFRLRQSYPQEKSENKDFQQFQDKANLILQKNNEQVSKNGNKELGL